MVRCLYRPREQLEIVLIEPPCPPPTIRCPVRAGNEYVEPLITVAKKDEPPKVEEEKPRPLWINFGGDTPVQATPEQRQYLIEKVCRWHPDKTEADALELLFGMSSGERKRMLMDAHERDDITDAGDRYHQGGWTETMQSLRPDDGWGKLWPSR